MTSLVAELIIGCFFGLFLLRTQEGAQPAQRLLREKEAGCDYRLATGDEAVSATLLVF